MSNPLNLFTQLDKSKSDISNLRKAQSEILEIYYNECLDEKRVGLKLPTGSGKSLIAILILEYFRRLGHKVAIMCGNSSLAEDMKNRFLEFDIPAETIFGASREDERSRFRNLLNYRRSKIIGIFNYHSFLYGFEAGNIVTPDILVIDDASDYETVRNNYYTIKLSKNNDNHKNAYNAILNKLSSYSPLYPNITEFINDTSNQASVEVVLFPHQNEIIKIIRNYHVELSQNDEFKYSYMRNQKYLNSALVFVTDYEIEIKPISISEELTNFYGIKQIIYMSATLPQKELLHKIFGINYSDIKILDESTLTIEALNEIETIGKRLIFCLGEGPSYKSVDIKSLDIILELNKMHKKTLVLVNSFRHAHQISNYLDENSIRTILYRNVNDSIRFCNDVDEGFLICANRYFGLDFPGNTCKVGIIVKLPSIWDSYDAFQHSILNNKYYGDQRVGNRLTQAFGRCNRLIGDEALYYILDSRIIAKLTGNADYLSYLPRNIYAEMMAGYILSEGEINKALDYGNTSFFGVHDEDLSKIMDEEKDYWEKPEDAFFASKHADEIEAWKNSLVGSYDEAGSLFNGVAIFLEKNIIDFPNQKLNLLSAWNFYLAAVNYFNAHTHFNRNEDKESCLLNLEKSIELGENSSWFNRLRSIYNSLSEEKGKKMDYDEKIIEAKRLKENISLDYDDYIERNNSKKKDWKQKFMEIRKHITNGTHGQCLAALEIIFELLGYNTKRGNNQLGEPDLIALSSQTTNKYQLGIEVKTKENGSEEGVSTIGQLLVDISIFKRKRPDYLTIPVVITQKEKYSEKAINASKNNITLLTTDTVQKIIEKLFEQMSSWERLNENQKLTFTDSIISPHELYDLFSVKPSPILTIE